MKELKIEEKDEVKTEEDTSTESSTVQESSNSPSDTDTVKKREELLKEYEGLLKRKEKLFNEVTSLRKERRELRSDSNESTTQHSDTKSDNPSEDTEVSNVEERVYQRIKKEQHVKNKHKAFDKFIKAHPEYSPEKDIEDIQINRLKSEFDFIKLRGTDVDDIYEGLEKAHLILNKDRLYEDINKQKEARIRQAQARDSSSVGSAIGVDTSLESEVPNQLSSEQEEIKKAFGIKNDKYLKDSFIQGFNS